MTSGAAPRVRGAPASAGRVQGFGRLWQTTYRVGLDGTGFSPAEVVRAWRSASGAEARVLYADGESVTSVTPPGHSLAGWVTFAAADDRDGLHARVQVLARATDPLRELALPLVRRRQDRSWSVALSALARDLGRPDAHVTVITTRVDRRRQWSRAANLFRRRGSDRSGG
jgi:hypothetical protein